MKKQVLTYSLVFFFIILYGCAGAPSPSEKISDPGHEKTSDTAIVKADKTVKITVPLLLSETKFQKNGYTDTKVVNVYEKGTDRLISSVTYDNTGGVYETAKTQYSGNEAVISYYDRENVLLKKRKTLLDNNGNILETILFDSNEKQVSKTAFKYDSRNVKFRWEIYDSADVLLGYNQYIYENGKNIRTDSFSPSGVLEEYFTYTYISDNMIESVHFSKAGKKLSGTVYSYKDNLPVSEKIYKGEKTLLNDISYEYSENDGKRTEKRIIKASDGEAVEIIEKVFSFIEKDITAKN